MPVVPLISYGVLASDWIESTRSHLLAFHREEMDLLAAPIADTTGMTVTLTDGAVKSLQGGAYLEVDTELLYVRTYDVASKTATVLRGQNGSVPATHAANAVVTVNPRFPRYRIFGALNDVLRDIGGTAYYQMKTASLVFDANVFTYDLGDPGALDCYEVTFPMAPSTQTKWQQMVQGFTLLQGADTSVFPSGVALQFDEPPGVASGQPIQVRYKAGFVSLSDPTSDVATTGIPSGGLDIPPLGAAIRMLAGREVKRNFTEGQPEPRRGSEVPPGAVLGSSRALQQLFQQRIVSETRQLALQWPARKHLYGRPNRLAGAIR